MDIGFRQLVTLLALTLVCTALAGCFPKTGHISWRATDDVEVALWNSDQLSGYNFFYSGPEAIPHTILAIKDDVPFAPNFWVPAPFGSRQVREWMAAIDNPHRDVQDMYYGGQLVDRKGNDLGLWYSKYRFYSGYIDSEGRLVVQRPIRRDRGWIFWNK